MLASSRLAGPAGRDAHHEVAEPRSAALLHPCAVKPCACTRACGTIAHRVATHSCRHLRVCSIAHVCNMTCTEPCLYCCTCCSVLCALPDPVSACPHATHPAAQHLVQAAFMHRLTPWHLPTSPRAHASLIVYPLRVLSMMLLPVFMHCRDASYERGRTRRRGSLMYHVSCWRIEVPLHPYIEFAHT